MKLRIGLMALIPLVCLSAGCQITPNPTVSTCPSSSGTAYSALNQATPATGLSYTDTNPAAGTYCYLVQSVITSTGQVSVPSNVPPPVVITGLTGAKSATVAWVAPSTGPAPTGYVVSRAAAVSSTLGAPVMSPPSTASVDLPPIPNMDSSTLLAVNAPQMVTGRAR